MKRSKAAGGVEVKQVIQTLCRLLAAVGLDAIPPPEAFRRAKFGDGPEEKFWEFLANLLQISGEVSSSQIPGGRRELVVVGLWQSGYHADWMYGRQDAASSRDLLLALGWLLAAGTLEKLFVRRVQELDHTLLHALQVKTEFSGEFQVDLASLKRLHWLTGSLKYHGRTLLSLIHERTRILHTVLSSAAQSSAVLQQVPAPPSAADVCLQQDAVSLQQLCRLMEAYLSWRQVEKVFWIWMDSVIDTHHSGLERRRPQQPPSRGQTVCHHGDGGLWKLDNVLRSLPETNPEEMLQGAPSHPLVCDPLPVLSQLPQVCRARLQVDERPAPRGQREGLQKHKEGSCVTDPAEPLGVVGASLEFPVRQAVDLLLQAERELLQQKNRRRLSNRMKLQDLLSKRKEMLLVPLDRT